MSWHENMQVPPFNTTFGGPGAGSQTDDDWEDWLRWDPAVDAGSPENDFSHSGSSKNDSPVQTAAYPVRSASFDKPGDNETLAPPLVVGEDSLDLTAGSILDDHVFHFGNQPTTTDYNFDYMALNPQSEAANILQQNDEASWLEPTLGNRAMLPVLQTDSEQISHSSGPETATTPSLLHSPGSSSDKRTSLSSHPSPDPPKKRGGRKRKAEEDLKLLEMENDNEETLFDNDGQPIKKTSHNVIEKRYRNNLNDKIVELRNSVPSLRALNRATKGQDTEDLEGLTPAHKHNKATIMAKATEYIKHLEKRNKVMQDEMDALKAKFSSVEAAFNKTRSRQGSFVESASRDTPAFLNVPQRGQFQQYQQQTSPTYARPPNPPAEAQNHQVQQNGGGIANKIMLGGMAGLMMIEGLSSDQGDTHGLGMLPSAQFLSRRSLDLPFGPSFAGQQTFIPLLKIVLVVSAFACIILPYLTAPPPQQKPTMRPTMRLPQAPSLASPVEVRRKAWLTAIQSVWVPKHFLLEVITVLSKMFKLFLRRITGNQLFAFMTGAVKEDEAARVKAWDIAIDAQLAGGDAEVSYYRLLLTLMASGTLPDSPTRLMQKAVHFRVFFWEVANAGYGNLVMFKQFTEKVGKFYWDSARRVQREIIAAQTNGSSVDLLPDHLACLLELDCDEVFSDEMIQRAWNLAWNKSSANGVADNVARDSVVMDHAIRSPLDAVAAWYSNMLIDETLIRTLGSTASKIDMEYHVNLAISIAPPASGTQSRALATKAVLSRSNRSINIITALDALPDAAALSSSSMNLVSHVPASPEVRTALTLAKLASLSCDTHRTMHANTEEMLSVFRIAPQSFSLLTSVAAYQLLQAIGRQKGISFSAAQSLEDMSCSLRIWIGSSAARQAGLDAENRAEIVERCLEIAKIFGGWDGQDSGYGSHAASKAGSPVRENDETLSVIAN